MKIFFQKSTLLLTLISLFLFAACSDDGGSGDSPAPDPDPTPDPVTITYTVTHSGASDYVFNGNGLTNAADPGITLKRGTTYDFAVNAPGHPFWIKSVQGNGTENTFSNGVTNNGAVNGTIRFVVPSDAPNQLFYNCEFHGSMTGVFTIVN